MRIIVIESRELGTMEVKEIVDIGYDEDILDNGGEVSGLYFVDVDGYYFYISNVSVERCNDICEIILCEGYCDVLDLGEYEVLESDEE